MTTAKAPLNSKGRTSDYILEGIFGASERFPATETFIEDFNDAIDNEDIDKATSLFEAISESIEGDAPELMLLKKRLKRLSGEQ